MAVPRSGQFTYADYRRLPDDGNRYEIIDGELFVTPAPVWRHQTISYWITRLVGAWIDSRNLGRLMAAPMDVILANQVIVQPDHLFIRKERIPEIVDRWVHGPPDLVIEILSPSTAGRDQVIKRRAYAKKAIAEYWLVDPETETVTVLTLRGNHYVKLGAASADQPIPSRVLAGLPVTGGELFRD